MMVAEPRDLIQAKALDSADGVAAVNSIERYHKDEVKELIDINFEED
ncbi:MAG: pilus assembly protein CpaD [Pseudomonadota bacterium]|nr:pilus assembly protein CpaD [Pseudomonadota bacterium]